jgi:hypothetical protein
MTQARGFKAKSTIDFEAAFGVVLVSGSRLGYSVPINKNTVGSSRKLTAPSTLTGRRDPVEPDEDKLDCSGSLEVPVDAHNFGVHLRAMFGLPVTTTQVVSILLNAAPAVDKGNGKVGLPSTAHGLAVGAPVIIAGNANYAGAYLLEQETTANELVITKAYTSVTFTGAETVTLARKITFAGAARNASGGIVGLPCVGHGLPVGAEIVVSGSTNYNGTYTVKRGTSVDEILVTKTYTAETFSGGATTATCAFHDKVFKVQDTMPSFLVEKAFADVGQYYWPRGCKISKLGLKFSATGELVASLDVLGAGEDKSTSAYTANAVALPFLRFKMKHLSLTEGGSVSTNRVATADLNVDFGLDGDAYTINTLDKAGERGDIGEGLLSVSGSIDALFTDSVFIDKALNSVESSLAMLLTNGGYQLAISVPELKYERSTPGIDGPKGVHETHAFIGYYGNDTNNSCLVVRQRNEIKTMTE